jgi:hypothetical protein
MASCKQFAAARRNINRASATAKARQSVANLPAQTRTALGKQGARALGHK